MHMYTYIQMFIHIHICTFIYWLGTEIADETDYHDGDGDLERMNKRDIDLAKLHLLNTQMDEDQLTSGEVFMYINVYMCVYI
jgi:hypothetical protein